MSAQLEPLSKIKNYISAENFPSLSDDWRNFLFLEATRMVEMKRALESYSEYKPNTDSYPITYREVITIVKAQVTAELEGQDDNAILAETKKRFLKLIKDNPKAFTITGHPTEVLSSVGVRARDSLRKHITQNWQDLNAQTSPSLPEDIAKALQNLGDAITKHKPSRKSMGQEQRDAKRASEKYFDAVSLEYNNVQGALEYADCDTNIDDIDPLLSLFSWIFDNDGKPELTPDEMRDALDLFKSAILAKDVKELATLSTMLEEHPDLQNKVSKLSFKLINSISREDPKKQVKEIANIEFWAKKILAKDEQTKPIAAKMIQALNLFANTAETRGNIVHSGVPVSFEQYTSEDATALQQLKAQERIIHRQRLQSQVPTLNATEALYFESETELLKEFAELVKEIRNSAAPENAKHFAGQLNHAVKCFGLTAAKAEFRQSIEVYQLAHIKLISLLTEKNLIPEGTDVSNPQALAEYLSHIKTFETEKLREIKAVISEEVELIKAQHWFLECREKLSSKDIPEEHRPEYYFADLVEKLNLVSINHAVAPVILGAECNNENGAVLMAIMYTLSAKTEETKNIIMPLVEYKEAVMRHEEITANLRANNAFMTLIDGKFNGIMLAGSDASKTMSSAAAQFTDTGNYIGAGSGLQRNAIPMQDPEKVTEQGMKMGHTSPEQIAAEIQLTRSAKLAKALETKYRNKLTDAEVVVNIGNRLKLKTAENSLADGKVKADSYEALYNTGELSAFFDHFTQKEVEASHSYAARPDKRPIYEYLKKATTTLSRSIFGVRAIGHGRRGRSKFGTLILSAEAAEMLGANERGLFEENNLDKAVAKYRTDPFCQHAINGAIDDIAIVHAEESGWANIAKILSEKSGKKIQITRKLNEDGSVTLQINNLKLDYQLLLNSGDERNKLSKAMDQLSPKHKENGELTMGIIGAVIHDWEHIKSTRAITQVLAKMNKQSVPPVTSNPDTLLDQLSLLNKAHGKALIRNREIASQAAPSMIASEDKSGAHACLAFMTETVPITNMFPQLSTGQLKAA